MLQPKAIRLERWSMAAAHRQHLLQKMSSFPAIARIHQAILVAMLQPSERWG